MSSASLWVQTQHLPSRGLGLSTGEPVPLGGGPSFDRRPASAAELHSGLLLMLQILCASPRLREGITDSAHLAPAFAAGFICWICYVENSFLLSHWCCFRCLGPAGRPAARNKVPQGCSWNKCSSFELWAGLVSLPCCILLSWSVQIATTQTK